MNLLKKTLTYFFLLLGLLGDAQPWEKVINGSASGNMFSLNSAFHQHFGGAVILTEAIGTVWPHTIVSYNNVGDTVFRKHISYDSLGGSSLPFIPTVNIKIDEFGNRVLYGYMVMWNNNYRGFVVKFDSLGNLVSNRYIQEYDNLYHFNVVCSKDNFEYEFYTTDLVTGVITNSNIPFQVHQIDNVITKRNQSGNIVWQTQDTDFDTIANQVYSQKLAVKYSPLETLDGMFTFARFGISSTEVSMLSKIDTAGNVQYNVPLGNFIKNDINPPEFINSSFSTRDTCVNYCGIRTIPSNTAVQESYLIKIDKYGNIRDSLFLSNVMFYNGVETTNGNIVLSYQQNASGTMGFIVLNEHFAVIQTIPAQVLDSYNYNISTSSSGGVHLADFIVNPGALRICNFDSLFNTYPNILAGSIYEDLNKNCTYDSGDNGRAQLPVVCSDQQNINHYGFSNASGQYSIKIPDGGYTISHDPGLYRSVMCPGATTYFTFGSSNTLTTQNYFDTITPNINDLKITLIADPFWIGNSSALTVYYENVGTITTNATIRVIKDSALVYSSSSPTVSSVSGDTLLYSLSNLQPNATGYITIYFSPSQSISSGNHITFKTDIFNSFPDFSGTDNSDSIVNLLYGSLKISGPNPQVSTSNNINVNKPVEVFGNDELAYKIRFQNTTGHSVKDVTIITKLDANLDLSSFKILSSSYADPSIKLTNDGKLIFTFKNINLQDSATNASMSKGYVSYVIRPKSSWPINQFIYNKADIYFDYLSVIATNQTKNKKNAYLLGIKESQQIKKENLIVFPNPAQEVLNIYIRETTRVQSVRIFNLIGQEVFHEELESSSDHIRIATDNFKNGVYLLQIKTEIGVLTKKIIVKRD